MFNTIYSCHSLTFHKRCGRSLNTSPISALSLPQGEWRGREEGEGEHRLALNTSPKRGRRHFANGLKKCLSILKLFDVQMPTLVSIFQLSVLPRPPHPPPAPAAPVATPFRIRTCTSTGNWQLATVSSKLKLDKQHSIYFYRFNLNIYLLSSAKSVQTRGMSNCQFWRRQKRRVESAECAECAAEQAKGAGKQLPIGLVENPL